MSFALDHLPDLSPIGGRWTTTTIPASHTRDGHTREGGLAELPGITWEYTPAECAGPPWGDWYLDGTVLLCPGCGIDIT